MKSPDYRSYAAWRAGKAGASGWRPLATVALVAALSSCAHEAARGPLPAVNRGDASWQAVEQPDTVHYQLAMGEVSSGGTAQHRVTPIYPASQLAACPAAVAVTVKLIVDPAGRVDDVRPGDAASASPGLGPFLEAARTAARDWTFDPLQVNRWAADAKGDSHVVDSRTLPFSLDYVFRFTCHAGRARVSDGDAAVAPG